MQVVLTPAYSRDAIISHHNLVTEKRGLDTKFVIGLISAGPSKTLGLLRRKYI